MTYKEIINRFRQVTEEHLMLQDFGYGQLSDLKTQSQLGPEEQGVDYPYLFLLPGTSNRTQSVMNYSFNMVIMDMARGEEGDSYDNYITIQSQCQQYIDDVLGQLYYAYKDQPEIELTGISYTPFKEKYQDEVAGMTATITIQVPTPIDNCIAPFAPRTEEYVWTKQLTPQTVGSDVGEQNNFAYAYPIINTDDAWTVNRFNTVTEGTYSFETNYTFQFETPDAGETYPNPPELRNYPAAGGQSFIPADTISGWPETPQAGVTYTIKQTWDLQPRTVGTFEFVYMNDEAGPQTEMLVDTGAELKIYKAI